MIIVGELINASRKAIAPAIKNENVGTIQKVARDQHEAGADFIDVNAGVFEDKESAYLQWLVETVQQVVDGPCCLDSPNPAAIETGLAVHRGTPIINSISLEKTRYEPMLSFLAGSDVKVVALCMSDDGMPESTDDRLAVADELINGLVGRGLPIENIFVDLLLQPVSTESSYARQFMAAVTEVMTRFPGVHTICGLSNVSFGLPKRKALNRAFASMAVASGLDAAILNPTDRKLMTTIYAAEALTGRDEFCGGYIDAYRADKLDL